MQNNALTVALRKYFQSHIFARGKGYFEQGMVVSLEIREDYLGEFFVSATVHGSDTYDTNLVFETSTNSFMEFGCTCPYAYEDNCKHEAALGLAFIAQYTNEEKTSIREAEIVPNEKSTQDISTLLGQVANGSLSLEEIEGAIKQLEVLKQQATVATPIHEKSLKQIWPRPDSYKPTAPKPSLTDYYLAFSRWDGKLSFRHHDNPYQCASINHVLNNADTLTTDEKELLEGLKETSNTALTQTIDIAHFLMLAVKLGIKIRNADQWSYHNRDNGYTLNLKPLKLSATLSFEEMFQETDYVEHPRFVFTLNHLDVDRSTYTFIASNKHLLRIHKNTIELHPMSARLATCLSDLFHSSDLNDNTVTFSLSDNDTININDIITDAKNALSLTLQCAPSYKLCAYTNPKKILAVDFKHTEEILTVNTLVDYGFTRVDVVDTVMVQSNYGRKSFKRRNHSYLRPDTHVITFEDTTIHYAPIDVAMEEKLFIGLYDKGVLPNMKPRATLKKHAKIFNFYQTYWQKLEKCCQKIGCEIIFLHDTLIFTEGDFRADFSIDINTENDWLAFDTACYLGEDKVTLEDIQRMLEAGHEFFQKTDGRLMRITNREELEQFIAMLKRFSLREGRFEGRLYNAPELQYTVTNSPYYNSLHSKGFNTFCKSVHAGKPIKRIILPKAQRELLRPYQKEGVEWLYFLRSYHFAGILADDMGLGKTLQALVLLERERVVSAPSLVICPKSLLYNWQAEASKFTPKLKVAVVDGTPAERMGIIKQAKKYDLLITGYATYRIDAPLYKKRKITFNYCVLDEAQFIKNHATKNAQIVKEVDARWRLALTGTPLENNVSEIWSIFDFLMPGFLGTYKEFSTQFHIPIMKHGDAQVLTYLRKKVECFMLRRTKEEVLPELPPKIIQDSHCHLDAAQNILYQEVLTRVKQDIWETVEKKGFEKSGIHILAGLTKLRQVCNHPNLLLKEKDHTKHSSAKLDMFHELVSEVHQRGRKVLVFSQFTGMLDILAKELDTKNISYVYLSGKTRNRHKMVDTFNTDATITVFLISLKAGGTGLNLTSADTVIIFDPWWNPSVENQAIDRAHRIGQQSSVNVYKLITEGTIEERIIALQNKKKNLFDALVSENTDMFKKLTWDDIQELFR